MSLKKSKFIKLLNFSIQSFSYFWIARLLNSVQNLIKTALFSHNFNKNLFIFIKNQCYFNLILIFSFKSFNMIEQMITHQSAAAAQAADISFNIVRVQHEAQHLSLSIIIIQQTQSTWFRILESDAVNVSASILFLLSDIKNPVKLKKINNMKLMNSNFCEWKNIMLAEFKYYDIDKIITDFHNFLIIIIKLNY